MLKMVDGLWVDDGSTPLLVDQSDQAASSTALFAGTPNAVANTITSLSATQQAAINYLSGVSPDGTLAATSFTRWNGLTPAGYGDNGSAAKWGAGTAYTSGGTVTYAYDTGSNWTTLEQNTFAASLQLWSDEANITFTPVANVSTAQLVFYRFGVNAASPTFDATRWGGAQAGGAYASSLPTAVNINPAGSTTINSFTGAFVSIQTNDANGPTSFGNIGSFTAAINPGLGGYGTATVVHEVGHVMGLGHSGPYNANANSQTQQLSQYDNYSFSIMSYIKPTDTTAKYYSSYPVNTNYGNTDSSFTPAIDDILAVQELYGAPTAGDLTRTQTFGFNTTITDNAKPFFDFTQDTLPVVTIYDTAAANTLDLSGWSSAATVNLNPGTFSSANGMTNNISIAYNTAVDRFIGGAGDDRITLNSNNDTIDGGGGTDTVVFSTNRSSWTLSRTGTTVTAGNGSVTETLRNIATLQFADQAVATSSIACFVDGTRIETDRGAVAVGDLRVGDKVRTVAGPMRPVIWTGYRRLACDRHPRPQDVQPVCVRKGAFGPALPVRDLWLSPDHAVFEAGVLVPVRYLVNGRSIVQESVREVLYFHVELDAHDVLLAEGLPCESYLDTGNRAAFANHDGAVMAHADFARGVWQVAGCAPLCLEGPELDAIREQVLVRAAALGHVRSTETELQLEVGGEILEPDWTDREIGFALPEQAGLVRLLTRSFVPAQTRAAERDTRCLGVAVSALRIDGVAVPLDSPLLGRGWYPTEGDFRWTDGAAEIDCTGACLIELELVMTGTYWTQAAA